MRRPLVVIAAVLLAAGCKGPDSASAPVDPFFGRTRIEPPKTGSVTAPRANDPYYSGTRQATLPKPPAMPRSGGVPVPSGASSWQPPGGSQPPSSGLRLQNVSTPGATPSLTPSPQPRQGDLVTVPVGARTQPANPAITPDTSPSTYDAARQLASNVYEQGKSVYERGKATVLANRERMVGALAPQPQQAGSPPAAAARTPAAPATTSEPRKLSIPGTKPVNITELPGVR